METPGWFLLSLCLPRATWLFGRICPYVCLSFYPTVPLVRPSVRLSNCLSLGLYACLSICLSTSTAIFLSVFAPGFYNLAGVQKPIFLLWNKIIVNLPFHYFYLVVCSFLRKIATMTKPVPAAPKRIREPGGTSIATRPTWTDCTSMVHMRLTPMESTGPVLGATTIHLNALRWKLKLKHKFLSQFNPPREQLFSK